MKAVLYGIGDNLLKALESYNIPDDNIKCFVDKFKTRENVPVRYRDIPIMTWDQYVKADKDDSDIIIICSDRYIFDIYETIKGSSSYTFNVETLSCWVRNNGFECSSVLRNQQINAELLKNAGLLNCREAVLPLLNKNGVVAEVGVAAGGFSEKILTMLEPSKFYAIDLFDFEDMDSWDSSVNQGDMSHYDYYKKKFQKEIESGKLEMKRGISWDILNDFPDDYFDYIYIDAGHDYESVKKDTEAAYRKVKHEGIIQFNDYIIKDYTIDVAYGICPVVNRFVNETFSQIIWYCLSVSGFDDVVVKVNKKSGFCGYI